ncbi:hypothetical protein DSL72_004079 [Monilinia vaccinii-corymbosi]|uniref:Pal1 cell morphology protein n=1 Tax=Monilinia vaccinii-corymbosi TaxID=61207 RepID=A0A8A3P1A1_9HELO|nr:hypothetical protein DSL72_004079 [Monilinia vaccinii-corymbosi]
MGMFSVSIPKSPHLHLHRKHPQRQTKQAAQCPLTPLPLLSLSSTSMGANQAPKPVLGAIMRLPPHELNRPVLAEAVQPGRHPGHPPTQHPPPQPVPPNRPSAPTIPIDLIANPLSGATPMRAMGEAARARVSTNPSVMMPLAQLRQETKTAYRSPHLRKKHIPGADTIDSLDHTAFGGAYHHEGPYDATLMARNRSYKNSPVAAVAGTNEEAIRATPREFIQDSLDRHVPLSGTAVIPPGMPGPDGKIMDYEEGADLMREADAAGGAYKRWDHVVRVASPSITYTKFRRESTFQPQVYFQTIAKPQPRNPLCLTPQTNILPPPQKYLPEDYKGKGEPSFSIEKALKERSAAQKSSRRRSILSDGNSAYEMQCRRPSTSLGASSGTHLSLPPIQRHRSATGTGTGTNNNNSSSSTSRTHARTVDFSPDDDMRIGIGIGTDATTNQRSSSTGRTHRMGEGLKRRFGGLRRSLKGV